MSGLISFLPQIVSVLIVLIVYYFLISEKINKVIVVMIGGASLIIMQIFASQQHTSQENAFEFISNNLDVLGFIIGMMILVGIVRKSGLFEAFAIWLVKAIKGDPKKLLVSIGYLTIIMTMFLSNIPTILILTPVILVLIKQLKLPYLPYMFIMVTMANIGGAATPISDPTTYYQAKTVGLSFGEVIANSGMIVLILSAVVTLYTLFLFRKDLNKVVSAENEVENFQPKRAITNKHILKVGTPILIITILTIILKESIFSAFGIQLDNASVVFLAGFITVLLFKIPVKTVLYELIDWEIIFFFIGLFIVVGSLEFTGIIELISAWMVTITSGNINLLAFFISIGSGLLSVLIDNVPYNITMVGAIQSMADQGLHVYPLWWALNLGTSIGGAGSLIGAACNVVAFGQAEKDGYHPNFLKYIVMSLPLVVINALITYGIIWLRYIH